MPQNAVNAPREFRDYSESAGLGSLIWGAQAQFFVRYFHYVVAFLTSLILLLVIVPYSWPLALTIVAGYLIYVAARKGLTRRPALERKFYQPYAQLLRAEMGWIVITLLLFTIPGSSYSALWLLYILILMQASRHCPTEFVIILYAQSALALIATRAQVLAWVHVLSSPNLWADVLVMGLFVYVIHYLIRNIEARNWTIASHAIAKIFSRQFDSTEPPTAITVIPAQPPAAHGAGCADALLAGLLILLVLLLVGRIL